MKKKWMGRLCAALCALALTVPAGAEEAPELLEPVGVTLSTAEAYVGELSKLTVYHGSVNPYTEGVYFTVEGEVKEICVIVGQEVKAGDPLMRLNQESQDERREELAEEIAALEVAMDYEEALAQLDLRILELELERLGSQSPRDDQAIALKRLDIEEFELNRAMEIELNQIEMERLQTELEQLEDESAKAVITAPFDGTVMFLADVNVGDHVGAYSPVVYLADETRLSVETDYISESYLDVANEIYALVGDQRLEVEAVPVDRTEYVNRTLAGETVLTQFVILDGADSVSAGEYAAICTVSGRVEDALIIPANALYTGVNGRYVYVVENGQRTHREVKAGLITAWEAQIVEGLEEGELVYVSD